jgi:hypothetical protein
LKLTASKLPGLGHVAYRTRSPQALERRVAALKGSGSRKKGQAWGLKTIESFHTYGTPPVKVATKR